MTRKNEQLRIPDGTVEDVLEWVGLDPERAFLAINHEQGKESPRSSLVEPLERIAYDPDGLYEFTGPADLYYPGYLLQEEDGTTSPCHARPGMDPVMFTPAGEQDLPIPPRDGNWVPVRARMGADKAKKADESKDGD